MAAKKTSQKTAAKQPVTESATADKPTTPVKKTVEKVLPAPEKTPDTVPTKKAPVAKTAVPAKKAESSKKAAPVKAEKAPEEKAIATKAGKQQALAKKPTSAPMVTPVTEKQPAAAREPKAKPVVKKSEASASVEAAAAAKKQTAGKRSSLVDYPAPPAPVRPPFVPPKPATPVKEGAHSSGTTGSHSAAFIQKQKQRLLDLRDNLFDAMSGMTRDTIRNAPEGSEASGSGMHQGDAGSDAYDRDFALSVLAKEQDALYEIEQALRRIQSGTYGVCEISSKKIPQSRLEVIPFARLTVEEQAQWEKEYGNRRFRPSNEVGFSGGNTSDDEDSETVSLDEDED